MKITAIRTTTNAVGQYRVAHPLIALQDIGHECRMFTLDREGTRVTAADLVGDILILARLTSTDVFRLLEPIPAEMRPRVVYEIDDDPWEFHSWDKVHRELGFGYRRDVESVMGRCDAVTCSTPNLAARIRAQFPGMPIWVVPNAIDYQVRDWGRREERPVELQGKLVLGWTGSIHHGRDGQTLLSALPDVFDAHPEAVLLLQCDRSMYTQWTERLHRQGWGPRLRWTPPVPFDVHPAIYSLFDINLAPLEKTSFNTCKSDLRLIEGGAQGVPYVASNIAPYAEFHSTSAAIGGYLAGTTGEWATSINTLIKEREARGATLSTYVRNHRSLQTVAGTWQTAFEAICQGQPGPAVRERWTADRNDPCPCGSGRKAKKCCVGVYA